MKKILIVFVTGFLLSACQQEQRYTQQSPEIDSVKSLFELYNNGDFDGQKAFYADTAKLYYNVPESKPSTIDQIISIQKEEIAPFSAYSIDFTDDGVEMVLTQTKAKLGSTYGESGKPPWLLPDSLSRFQCILLSNLWMARSSRNLAIGTIHP